jgi:hypothetical protein
VPALAAEELAETARSLAGELVIDAVFAQRSHVEDIELRVELRASGCSSPSTATLRSWP